MVCTSRGNLTSAMVCGLFRISLKFKIVNFKFSFKNPHQAEGFHIKGFVNIEMKCRFQRISVLQTPLRHHPTLVSRIAPSSHTWDYCCQKQCCGETITTVNFLFFVTL